MEAAIFRGCLPALMTPCGADGRPDFDALAAKGKALVAAGMSGVVYCGSMGDWPLLTDEDRREGVARLVRAGVPVVVGTGAINSAAAAAHAAHAQAVGAAGIMAIPRVLSRGASIPAQRAHFHAVLSAAPGLPTVIYNSPVYGFATRADLFFEMRAAHPNLVGFKEFGGAADLSYAAEHITSAAPELALLVGVDTAVFHGFARCGAVGAITGIGNVLPEPVLTLVALCRRAADGDAQARRRALELDEALRVLSTFDEGADLVLYYKYLLTLEGDDAYERPFIETDRLSESQKAFAAAQLIQFKYWWAEWRRSG
ncbi:MAG: dihydrodipicolinate synthase family protein [Pseudomonadota bacterium]